MKNLVITVAQLKRLKEISSENIISYNKREPLNFTDVRDLEQLIFDLENLNEDLK